MTPAQANALRTIAAAVIEAAEQSAPIGAPAGHVYSETAPGASLLPQHLERLRRLENEFSRRMPQTFFINRR